LRLGHKSLLVYLNAKLPFWNTLVSKAFQRNDQGHRYLLMAVGCTANWQEANGIPIQEASTVAKMAEMLPTNFLCRLGVPLELESDQGHNFESRLVQEVLQRRGVSKSRAIILHPQSDVMVE
jgi:hypothetical protein